MKKGKIIILSGPSGSGKTTISHFLLSKIPELKFSVSCTNRIIRKNEKHGKDYYFISLETFITKIKESKFAEWEEVYPKLFYGTLKNEIYNILNSNKHILFDVDIKGALNLKKKYTNSLSIFITVDSMKILKKRLFYRNSENLHKINIRLNKAKKEMSYAHFFDLILLNTDLFKIKQKVYNLVYNFIYNN
ncbi:guanylate kinase [Blattabacterium cuenoti]|uniref:guanylate kinase n=1 Tax=Blattabacterium cuenoti TaxID=1653831 RepID=UPI00163B8E6B|nr:guanylate kinase [Blattabacterium cuenoti]